MYRVVVEVVLEVAVELARSFVVFQILRVSLEPELEETSVRRRLRQN